MGWADKFQVKMQLFSSEMGESSINLEYLNVRFKKSKKFFLWQPNFHKNMQNLRKKNFRSKIPI